MKLRPIVPSGQEQQELPRDVRPDSGSQNPSHCPSQLQGSWEADGGGPSPGHPAPPWEWEQTEAKQDASPMAGSSPFVDSTLS